MRPKTLKIIAASSGIATFTVAPTFAVAYKIILDTRARRDGLIIGAKAFGEGLILANMQELMVNHWTDIYTKLVTGIDSPLAPELLNNKNIHTIAEYTGSIYDNYWKKSPKNTGAKTVDNFNLDDYVNYMDEFEATKDLELIYDNQQTPKGVGFENSYALIARKGEFAGVNSLKDLFDKDDKKIGLSTNVLVSSGILNKMLDISERNQYDNSKDSQKARERLETKKWEVKTLDSTDNKYEMLKNGNIDIALGYTTDSQINEFNKLNLSDLNNNFVSYQAAYIISKQKLQQFSSIKLKKTPDSRKTEGVELKSILQAIRITTDEMIAMNKKLAEKNIENENTPYQIAKRFLEAKDYFKNNL